MIIAKKIGQKWIKLNSHIRDPLFSNAYFLMGNTMVSSAIGFLFWIIATQLYSAKDIGLGSALISIMGIISLLSQLGLDVCIIRFIPGEKNKADMVNSCLTITALTSVALSAIFIWWTDKWFPELIFIKSSYSFILLFFILNTMNSLLSFQLNTFIAFRNAKYAFTQAIITSSRILLLLIAKSLGGIGIYISAAIPIALAAFFGNYFIRGICPNYKPMTIVKPEIISNMFFYSIKNYIANLITNIPNFILPLIALSFLGATANAYFYISWQISLIILAIPLAMSRSLLAEESITEQRSTANMNKSIKHLLIILIPINFIIFSFGRDMLSLFGDLYSENSFWLLMILTLSSVPYSINIIYAAEKRIQNKLEQVIYMFGLMNLILYVCCIIFIPRLDLIGIGIAWFIANLIITIILLVKHLMDKLLMQ